MHCVILEHVLDETPDAGRILIAQIHGEAQRHSGGGRPLTGATHAAAVAALRELAGGYHRAVPPMALIAPLAQVTRSTNRSTPTRTITECQLQTLLPPGRAACPRAVA